ncbi:MAG: dihydroorotate dehydrogenase electron transfer subunit [Solirubrobacterales bacterium]
MADVAARSEPGAIEAPTAPLGARTCEVIGESTSGSYRLFTARDASGPVPTAGQFYMLSADRGWGGGRGRPYLPRAFSFARATQAGSSVELSFLGEVVGPGTARLLEMKSGELLRITGPLGRGFSLPSELNDSAAGAILVGGGIGVAPIAAFRDVLRERGAPVRTLLGFRGSGHQGGLELFSATGRRCPGVQLATEDGSQGHRGDVTELLATMLDGDDASSASVYACGPPAMLEAVRQICESADVPAELALETPMACGFGACMGCAVPLASGGYMRLCVDGPVVNAADIETALIPGSGH